MAEHGARYERCSVVVRRVSVIVGTRESDEIGDGDERACTEEEKEKEREQERKRERRRGRVGGERAKVQRR